MDSILDSVKQMLGIEPDDESFDPEIIMHINSAFMTLNTLGIESRRCLFHQGSRQHMGRIL